MSKEKTYGIKWRSGQTEADVIDARPRFSIARAAAEAKRHGLEWLAVEEAAAEADLMEAMRVGFGFGETDLDGRPIER
jgi:hypothetical protein